MFIQCFNLRIDMGCNVFIQCFNLRIDMGCNVFIQCFDLRIDMGCLCLCNHQKRIVPVFKF